MTDTESAAAARAAASNERSTPPVGRVETQGDDLRHSALTEIVNAAVGTAAGTGVAAGAKLMAGAAVDKVKGKTGGNHKAKKD